MDDFMQWAMNSLEHHQQQASAAPPSYSGDCSGGAGPAAFPFPSLQALRCQQSTAAGRDLTVQIDQHRVASSWTASSGDSPGAAVMDYDATAAGWSPHTARARTSRPVSWNFSASAASAQTTDASASLASPASGSVRGGPSTPAAGSRAGSGWMLAAPTASHGQGGGGGGGGTTAASSSASAGGPVQDHIIAERRRREKINQRFIELSTVIPGLKKVLLLPSSICLTSTIPFHVKIASVV